MLILIGTKNCPKCNIVRDILETKNVEYEYKVINELPEEEQQYYVKMAKQANQMNFPLIIKNNNFISIQEV